MLDCPVRELPTRLLCSFLPNPTHKPPSPPCNQPPSMRLEQLIEERDAELEENESLISTLRQALDSRNGEVVTLQSRLAQSSASIDAVRAASADDVARARAELAAAHTTAAEEIRQLKDALSRSNSELEQSKGELRASAVAKAEQDDALYRLTQEKADWEVCVGVARTADFARLVLL